MPKDIAFRDYIYKKYGNFWIELKESLNTVKEYVEEEKE